MFAYCNNNPIASTDPTGTIIEFEAGSSDEEMAQYVCAINYIKSTEVGATLVKKLEESNLVFTIVFVDNDGFSFASRSRSIRFNPHCGHIMADGKSVQSAALGLAHEMGHAAQLIDGELLADHQKTEDANLWKYETPIARQLGEPVRKCYSECFGAKRTYCSTQFYNALWSKYGPSRFYADQSTSTAW